MLRISFLSAVLLMLGSVTSQAQITSNPVLTTWVHGPTAVRYSASRPVVPSPCCGAPTANACNTCAPATTAYYAPAPVQYAAPVASSCTTCASAAPTTVSYYAPAPVMPPVSYAAPVASRCNSCAASANVTYRAPTSVPGYSVPIARNCTSCAVASAPTATTSYYAPTATRYYPQASSVQMPGTTVYRSPGAVIAPPAATTNVTTTPATTYYPPTTATAPAYSALQRTVAPQRTVSAPTYSAPATSSSSCGCQGG